MAQSGYAPIQLYYSTTPGQQPAAADLVLGELAFNVYDGKLFYKDSGTGNVQTLVQAGSGAGSVTNFSIVSANGFAGTVTNPTSVPALTLTTNVTGIVKGNGTALSAAVAGTDYLAPFGSQTANYVFAAPNGSSGTPVFRALVAADLPNTTVSPGTYTAANITVDAQGRITAAASGTAGGGGTVTSITAGSGLSGGTITTTGTISLANTTVSPGSYTNASITVDSQGRITAASNGTSSGGVTSVATGTGLTGGPITSSGTISLANTAVTAGSYTLASVTVDAQGRLTSASNGAAVTSLVAGTGLSGGTITSTGTIALANTAVTAGSYTTANITVDAQGRITSASSGVIVERSTTTTSTSSIIPNCDTTDIYCVTALAANAAVGTPTGTPSNGQKLTIRITADGSTRNLTWTTSSGGYRAIGVTLPSQVAFLKTVYIGCLYNANAGYWDVVSIATQA